MYAKIFNQIYDGTLCTNGPWEALVTFQQLLILADQEGSVDMTLPAISRRTTIPLEILERGIEALLQADPHSRTPTEEGRRIIPLCDGRSWGWKVTNYVHYRQLKREEDRRAYHREYWHKRKSKDSSNDSMCSTSTQHTQPNQPIAEAEAEAFTQSSTVVETHGVPTIADCPHSEILKLWAEILPSARQPVDWNAQRQALLRSRWREKSSRQSLEWWRRFFEYVSRSDFLMGRTSSRDRSPFLLSLDWLLKPANFLKVLEGAFEPAEAANA
jgi:hypothetical protein